MNTVPKCSVCLRTGLALDLKELDGVRVPMCSDCINAVEMRDQEMAIVHAPQPPREYRAEPASVDLWPEREIVRLERELVRINEAKNWLRDLLRKNAEGLPSEQIKALAEQQGYGSTALTNARKRLPIVIYSIRGAMPRRTKWILREERTSR